VRWTVHGERSIYDSEWMCLRLTDVELPDGHRFEHHVVRYPHDAAGTVVVDPDRGVLLLWRHRFITDTWGWEIPAGRVDPGETPVHAAAREVLEETGWRPGDLRPIVSYHPSNGSADQVFHLFVADGAERVGDPVDAFESERIEWVTPERIRAEIRAGRMPDGMSLTGVLWWLGLEG
jgi:8-oxo-dGTP pyrophosphatase MutT (NUDIX family)